MDIEFRIAQTLGAHAVVAFAGALVVLLLLVLAAWLALERFDRAAGRRGLPPERLLLSRMLLGFVIVVGAGVAFAEMAEALDVRERMGRFDVALTEALRLRMSPAALQAFAWLTRLGDTATLTVLCVAVALWLLWHRQRTLSLAWVTAVAGNGVLNSLLKQLFERTRPIHTHELVVASGWSFPSGHSSGSVVAYGMLAYLASRWVPARWHLPVLLAGTAVAFTTGISRIVLQVHYASDVLAGFASGLLWLTVCILAVEWLRPAASRHRGQPPRST